MINISDFNKRAKQKLPKAIYDYYAGGACDEITLKKNRSSYDNIALIPRALIDISEKDLSTQILNQKISMPLLIAPTSFHGMANNEAECATASAAKKFNTIMIASTMSNTSLEEIALQYPEGLWFQLYLLNDRMITIDLIKRAETSGYKAIVLTVDSQVLGIREADLRNKFKLPSNLHIKNLLPYLNNQISPLSNNLKIQAGAQNLFCKKLTWSDVEWLQSISKLPIIIKGLLHKDDVKIAMDLGVDAVIVSNHGGRQLDTVISAIDALPQLKNLVSEKIPIIIDGGIRRGTDIIKALALGADAVLIGRPIIWGLAVNGCDGVNRILEIIRSEFDTAMSLCGLSTITEIKKNGKNIIHRP